MLMKKADLLHKANEAILDCLKDIPFLKIVSIDTYISTTTTTTNNNITPDELAKNFQPDLIVTISLSNSVKLLIVEINQNGQPLQAVKASEQLQRYMKVIPHSYGVFIAPFISEKSGEICSENNIGYLDLSGNCLLHFNSVYIKKSSHINIYKQKRELRSLFKPKAERILRTLLSNKIRHWKLSDLSREAQASIGHTYNVKNELIENAYASESKKGVYLTEPLNLLTDWSDNYNFERSSSHKYYGFDDINVAERKINNYARKSKIEISFTCFSGANLFAPIVLYNRIYLYIKEKYINVVAKHLDLKKIEKGHNIVFLDPYDAGVYYKAESIDGLETVTPIQLYLDLMSIKGRGEEAAEFLFEKTISKTW